MTKTAGQIEKILTCCVLMGLWGYMSKSLPLYLWPFLALGTAFLSSGTNSGTNQDNFGMAKDHKTNLPYKPAQLRDRNKDLSKEWYIEWYAWDELTNDLARKRKKVPMSFRDVKSRTNAGLAMCAKVDKLLATGYHFKTIKVDKEVNPLLKMKDLVNMLNYLVDLIRPGMAPKTILTYQSAINKMETYGGKNRIQIAEWNKEKTIQFRDYLVNNTGNSPTTANNTLQHLAAIFARYMERTGVKENVFKVKSLREQASDKNIAITKEDQVLIENYMREHEPQLYLVTRFIYQAFIRPGELLNIKIKDINLNAGYVTVHGQISKNGKTETAALIPSLCQEIRNRVDFTYPEKYIFSYSMYPGYTITGKQVPFRRHEKVLQALGLHKKGYTLYSWKHTGAVNAYQAGVGIKELQNLLRHSSVQITDIYLKSLGLRTDPKLNSYEW